jgi:hypothetical protein
MNNAVKMVNSLLNTAARASLFVFAFFLCIAIYGCSYEESSCDKSLYPYWTEWSKGSLKYIVDDSLAVVSTRKHKKECDEDNHVKITGSSSGLFLINYRTNGKALLGDTLEPKQDYGLEIASGYFKDSSVLVYDSKNSKLGLWKIGEKSIKFYKQFNDRPAGFENTSPWIGGRIIIRGVPTCVLEPEKGQIKLFNPSEEYEWIPEHIHSYINTYYADESWSYISYINGKVVCIKNNLKDGYAELLVDGIVNDTISRILNLGNWYGNYIQNGNDILKIDTESFKFDKDFKLEITYDGELR